jgi:hypothetical protein
MRSGLRGCGHSDAPPILPLVVCPGVHWLTALYPSCVAVGNTRSARCSMTRIWSSIPATRKS